MDNNSNSNSNFANDEDRQAREEEMSKLRASAGSPSTVSTASSGSPLVRNSSGTKRPAPTSIAAAQFEFAQRLAAGAKRPCGQQLEPDWLRANRVDNSGKTMKKPSKRVAIGHANDNRGTENKSLSYKLAKSAAFKAYRFNEFWSLNKMRYMNLACLLMTLLCLATILIFSGARHESPSFELQQQQQQTARVVARKGSQPATLANSELDDLASETIDSLESQPLRSSSLEKQFDDFGLFNVGQDLDNQRQNVGGKSRRKVAQSETANGADSVVAQLFDSSSQAPSVSSSSSSSPVEMATGIGGTTTGQQSSESGDIIDANNSLTLDPFSPARLISESMRQLAAAAANANGTDNGKPIVKRIVGKNGATIIISSFKATNSSLANDSMAGLPFPLSSLLEKLLPPMLRPPTTISISNSGFKPFSSLTSDNGPALISTTKLIGNQPASAESSGLFSASSSPFASFTRSFGPISLSPLSKTPYLATRGHPFSHQHHPLGQMFVEGPTGFMGSHSFASPSMFGGDPSPMFPSSLMGMLMRASQVAAAAADLEEQQEFQNQSATQSSQLAPNRMIFSQENTNNGTSKTSDKNDTLTAQASQLTNSTVTQQALKQNDLATKSSSIFGQSDPEVEMLDLFGHSSGRNNNWYQKAIRPRASTLIFSSGSFDGPRDHFSFNPLPAPFMGLAQMPMEPRMLLLGGLSSAPENSSPSIGPLVSSVHRDSQMSSNPNSQDKGTDKQSNKTQQQQQQQQQAAARRNSAINSSGLPSWASLSSSFEQPDSDNDWLNGGGSGSSESASDRWDEMPSVVGLGPVSSKQLRARHRDEEMDSSSDSASELVTNFQLDQQSQGSQMFDPNQLGSSGIVSGTIRQTIRGPGMTVERVIEVPATQALATGRHIMQKVAPGVRSQSLSRLADEQMAPSSSSSQSSSYDENPTATGASGEQSSIFGRPIIPMFGRGAQMKDRISSPGDELPPFISKLLADITSRRSSMSPESSSSSARRASDLFSLLKQNRPNSFSDEDLDEGDSSSSVDTIPEREGFGWSPKFRVASAQIRMRPIAMAEPRSSGSLESSNSVHPFGSQATLLPTHITIPDSASMHSLPTESASNHQQENNGEINSGKSFEDTLNSMEDRLNNVLSMASQRMFAEPTGTNQHQQHDITPQQQQQQQQQLQSQRHHPQHTSGGGNSDLHPQQTSSETPIQTATQISPISEGQSGIRFIKVTRPLRASVSVAQPTNNSNSIAATRALATSDEQHTNVPTQSQSQSQPQLLQAHSANQLAASTQTRRSDSNPFTSPSSPLFGFPTSSMGSIGQEAAQVPSGLHKVSPSQTLAIVPRQPRSFTYHSNNELASALVNAQKQQHQQQQRSSEAESSSIVVANDNSNNNFKPIQDQSKHAQSVFPPPASMIMGRRLDDDTPIAMQSLAHQPQLEQQQSQQSNPNKPIAAPAAGDDNQEIKKNSRMRMGRAWF